MITDVCSGKWTFWGRFTHCWFSFQIRQRRKHLNCMMEITMKRLTNLHTTMKHLPLQGLAGKRAPWGNSLRFYRSKNYQNHRVSPSYEYVTKFDDGCNDLNWSNWKFLLSISFCRCGYIWCYRLPRKLRLHLSYWYLKHFVRYPGNIARPMKVKQTYSLMMILIASILAVYFAFWTF